MRFRPFLFSSLLALPFLLAGCSTQFSAGSNASGAESVGGIQGLIHGGQQQIIGGHVFVLELKATAASISAPTGAYGGRSIAAAVTNLSKSLLTAQSGQNPTTLDSTISSPTNGDYYVQSGAGGFFNITGDYTCDSGSFVYLYANGGNPGQPDGTNNTAIGLLAPLGLCGSFGSSTFVYLNEVSTVATAYALAGFASDVLHVGSTGSVLANVGLTNAFATIGSLVDTTQGTAYASHNLANGGVATMPQQMVNTLANIIAACINTTSPSSTQCTTLFGNAKSGGGSSGTAPADTATAMINIAHYPGLSTLGTLYGLQTGVASPFVPNLGSQPPDFSMQTSYTGGGLTHQYTGGEDISVDGTGNIWVANSRDAITAGSGNSISRFSPLGVPANSGGFSTGFTASGGGPAQLSTPYGVAVSVDSSHVWIGNYDHGSVVDFNVGASTGIEYTLPNGEGILALAFDASGNLWGADLNNPSLVELNTSGTELHSFNGNGLNGPFDLAIAPSTGYIWIANGGNGGVSAFDGSGGAISNPSNPFQPADVAIDSTGNAWLVTSSDTSLHTVWKMDKSGTGSTSYVVPNAMGSDVWSDAIDGANNVWVTGSSDTSTANNQVWAVDSTGAPITGASHGLAPAPNNTTEPSAITVDQSGNVWYTSSSDATLHQIVGAAAPVTVPLSYATINNLVGTRP